MNYWLIKSEPDAYSFEQLEQENTGIWDGVRSYQARNNLKLMQKDDLCLFYHSNIGKEIVGIAQVCRLYFQDPTTTDERWVAIELKKHSRLEQKVTLQQIKNDPMLQNLALVKQSRLSVMPINKNEFDRILMLANQK